MFDRDNGRGIIMGKKKTGRPAVITQELLKKLEELFAKGLTDREAALLADITPQTLYNYCAAHPDFLERKELLKEQVKTRAKLNVAEAIENRDIEISKWYLERRAKDEFSTKQEIQAEARGEVTINIELTDE